jgi:hypothetical protein
MQQTFEETTVLAPRSGLIVRISEAFVLYRNVLRISYKDFSSALENKRGKEYSSKLHIFSKYVRCYFTRLVDLEVDIFSLEKLLALKQAWAISK